MAVRVEARKVDSRGRVYISSGLKGKVIYLVRNGDLVVLSSSREKVQEALVRLYGKSAIEEYLSLLGELGEASVEDVEKASREKVWKSLREY